MFRFSSLMCIISWYRAIFYRSIQGMIETMADTKKADNKKNDTKKVTDTKSVTVKFTKEQEEDLQFIVDFFQKNSISTVKKSDVIAYLATIFKVAIENENFNEIRELSKPRKDKSNE
jgi:hypothetical protein